MKKGILFICVLSLLFSSCVMYSRVQKDDSGEYVTQMGKRYTYYRIDNDRGYIFDESGKKIIITMVRGRQIKNLK
jgi:transposase